jgi:Flp pilus assembly protein TadG
MVETVFVVMVCFVFMFGLFEFGRIVYVRQLMENAARSGARVAVIIPTSSAPGATETTQVANAVVSSLGLQGATITTSQSGSNWVATITHTDPGLQNLTMTIFQADSTGKSIGPWTSAPFGQNIVVQLDGDLSNLFPPFDFLPSSGAAPNSTHLMTKAMMRGEAN